jgi:predicted AAA+ superfamily ATPase
MKDDISQASQAIEQLIRDARERPFPALTRRDVMLPEIRSKADVVIGMRRSGKTFMLFQEMQRVLATGVDVGSVLYLNCEDDRLRPLRPRLLDDALEAFFRMSPSARTNGAFLFLDEIQAVDGWSRFARRVLDTEQVRLYLSGSSAKLLSTEVSTEFRGRGFAVELLPFSFPEALRHAGIEPPVTLPGARLRSELEARFLRYLEVGGFPEVQDLDARVRIQVLQDYVELVLLRDIVERHSVSNVHAAKAFVHALLQASGRRFSVNKTYNDLKSRGVEVGKDTLHELLDYLSDAFLVFGIQVFRQSLRARQVNPRKIYAIDPGLAFATSHISAVDLGSRLETAVYLELRRRLGRVREGSISYHLTRSGYEVDFVLGNAEQGGASDMVQVCADLSDPATRARKLRALQDAMEELGSGSATLITLYADETVQTPAGAIRVVPAWQWFLRLV